MAIFHGGPPADLATRPAIPQTVRRHRMLRPPLLPAPQEPSVLISMNSTSLTPSQPALQGVPINQDYSSCLRLLGGLARKVGG